ncbi:hypothetical protein NXS19_014295 [Fusarium pseudograminearum]|nr:hypothetical protein NXS19_014295 [Fusarium pseudograminearum]
MLWLDILGLSDSRTLSLSTCGLGLVIWLPTMFQSSGMIFVSEPGLALFSEPLLVTIFTGSVQSAQKTFDSILLFIPWALQLIRNEYTAKRSSRRIMSAQFIEGTGQLAQVSADLGVSQACGFREDLSISADVVEQVKQLALNAHELLQASGATGGLKDVYQVTIYMTEMSDALNTAWKELKNKYGIRPIETGVTVPSLYGGAKVEMTFLRDRRGKLRLGRAVGFSSVLIGGLL